MVNIQQILGGRWIGRAQQGKIINKVSGCEIMIALSNPSYYTDLQLTADLLCANQRRSVETTALALDFGNSLLSIYVSLALEPLRGCRFRWSTL